MIKLTLKLTLFILFLSGCTQVITAPISAVSSVAGATIDVAGAAVGAAIPDDDD